MHAHSWYATQRLYYALSAVADFENIHRTRLNILSMSTVVAPFGGRFQTSHETRYNLIDLFYSFKIGFFTIHLWLY